MPAKKCLVYEGEKGVDITDGLNDDQFKLLITLSEENEMKDTYTMEEYTKLIEKWRAK
ncbi:MAG: hypothetical protein H7334_03835 [Ferruginibacter sp.]|nr:hypothetical protein [Ferruginibacter sp.]